MKEEKKAQRPVSSGVVSRALRGTRVYSQDLFKLKVASRLFNMAWQKYKPNLIEQEHCHFFRSVNDNGVPNEFSTAIGGHFHKVEVEWNADGTLKSAKCGPPLHKTQVALPRSGRKVSRVMGITFERETDRGVEEIVDDHTHEIEYIHTDEISPQKREAMRMAESAKVKTLLGDNAARALAATASVQENPQAKNLIETE